VKGVVIIIPVVVIAAVVGLGLSGVINIPGLSPKKKAKVAAGMYTEKDDKAVEAKKPPAKKPVATKQPPAKPKVKVIRLEKNSKKGAEALATVWNEVKIPELAQITASWKDDELAAVLNYMDTSKVAKFLEQIAKGDPPNKIDPNPKRASTLSKRLQELGSIVPPTES
jgi:hypothetical protein